MNQLDEQTRVWWTEGGFIATMATILASTMLLSPSTSVAYSNDSDTVAMAKAGERYSESRSVDPIDRLKSIKEFSGLELKELLQTVGFEGRSLKFAWAIAMKESRGRAKAYNGDRSTGDNSYGLFQINMIGDLGEARRVKFALDSNKELYDPVLNAQIAYYMSDGGEDWSSWKVDASKKDGGNDVFAEWLKQYPNN